MSKKQVLASLLEAVAVDLATWLAATYANFVFINGALIVPIYNDENDEKVCEILAHALPKREIVPVRAEVFLRQNGSLHCACQNRFKGAR